MSLERDWRGASYLPGWTAILFVCAILVADWICTSSSWIQKHKTHSSKIDIAKPWQCVTCSKYSHKQVPYFQHVPHFVGFSKLITTYMQHVDSKSKRSEKNTMPRWWNCTCRASRHLLLRMISPVSRNGPANSRLSLCMLIYLMGPFMHACHIVVVLHIGILFHRLALSSPTN